MRIFGKLFRDKRRRREVSKRTRKVTTKKKTVGKTYNGLQHLPNDDFLFGDNKRTSKRTRRKRATLCMVDERLEKQKNRIGLTGAILKKENLQAKLLVLP
ncbi:tight junction protein ZO-2 isoform X4 [Vespula maculifrons]|uniref:Uncharacterized protein n=2 Tax=Vespula TaxID=7451 RepID=A0A834MMS4_VESVU|nr:hypothetical protein HZH66_015209 [Vespula vulgaris]